MLLPQAALADTVPISVYRQRLESARVALATAREQPLAQRAGAIASIRATLGRTDAVESPSGGTVAVDDSRLVDRLDTSNAAIDAAIARLDARMALMNGAASPPIDPGRADAALRSAVSETTQPGASFLDVLATLLLRFLSGLRGPELDIRWLTTGVGLLGVAVILFVIATLGRGLPERVRREVLVSARLGDERVDPSAHLRAADAALAQAHPREAIHALYLYVLAALAERDIVRYDPSFTDRELLVATAAIPHADSLRDLVAIYERAWFGLREPSTDEARHARELALRVAP